MSHRIIVDVMGADNGSGVVIRGAVAGARRSGASLLLVGNRTVIQNELEDLKTKGLDIQIEHADTVIQMNDPPGCVRCFSNCKYCVGLHSVISVPPRLFPNKKPLRV